MSLTEKADSQKQSYYYSVIDMITMINTEWTAESPNALVKI